MRWIKHLATARNDEKIQELIQQFGPEAYGVWWMVCEIIAEQMDDSDKCEVSYPIQAWARKLALSTKKTNIYLQNFCNINLILIEYDDSNCVGKLKIKIPKLLKYRDEYSKKIRTKSGVTPDKLRSKIEIEKEIEIEKQNKKEKIPAPKKTFITPILDDVKAYCMERQNGIDAQYFHDYYSVRNWIPKGSTRQMKDWKAAIRTWEKNNGSNGNGTGKDRRKGMYEANESGTDFLS